ncbi:hypothetical protein HMPREF0005_02855 [Achromobacter xylosoxidans C54]|uniref:hypothetical protein n=1 Tax=Alcaligenes xylosoxydans xylosoxydans TaxID=85698 RepID=UPI0001F435DE|nr:hypothetical protein [Achromobacter xylosoxidans]EFV84113.1 hypothetical protein HMPREF0005_02855 [Achromobacter xylosoxidans C54]
MSACQCRERIDALLAERNTRVMQVFTLGENDIGMPWPVATEQVEKGRGKKKASLLFASYCPFCGVPLKPESTAAQQGKGGAA